MEGFVAWLEQLAPSTVYLVLGLSTLAENVIPPVPSDVVAALAGFLSRRNELNAVLLWAVAWGANMAGTVGVYFLARRYRERFVQGALGQRLLPPDAIVALEREYVRFGLAGIFVVRCLPGPRAFVAPFLGVANLGPVRALVPMALASGLWYAGMIWVGARVGAEWSAISRFLQQLGSTLAVVAGVLVAGIAVGIWRLGRRSSEGRRRLLRVLHLALDDTPAGDEGDLAARGAAALLYELTHADPAFTREERAAIAGFLRSRWGLGEPQAVPAGPSTSISVAESYPVERRVGLAARLYRVAAADGTLSRHEERLMRRVGDLLDLTPEELASARRWALS